MSREWTFTVQELADMTPSNARGSALDAPYALEPKVWLKEIVDAAKKVQQFVQFSRQVVVPAGNKDVVIPRRTKYIASGSTWAGDVAPGSAVNYTTINVVDGATLTPLDHNAGVAVPYDTIRTNLVDYVSEAKEQLTYYAGDMVDKTVSWDIVSGATMASSSAAGYQKCYGGDATQGSALTNGDIVTTDMIAEAKRKLQSTTCTYWTLGTGESNSSGAKNPWQNTPDAPFVALIAPEQEEAFLKDGQFINAANYGSDKVISNGEIGDYLGLKIVVSNNVYGVTSGSATPDGTTAATNIHVCPVIKSKYAHAIAWGQKPKMHIFDYPRELEMDIILEQAFATKAIQSDAIVLAYVADK